MAWKLRNVDLSLSVTVFGYFASVHFIPFRWAKPTYRTHKDIPFSGTKFSFQGFAGPFHVWTSKFEKTLAVEFDISQNGFHGTPIIARKNDV